MQRPKADFVAASAILTVAAFIWGGIAVVLLHASGLFDFPTGPILALTVMRTHVHLVHCPNAVQLAPAKNPNFHLAIAKSL